MHLPIGIIWFLPLAPCTFTVDTSHHLREAILDNLHSGQWRAGQRLPTERAFSEQFGLGRGSVRKVLQELRDLGLIRQTVGSGTYVTPEAESLVRGLAGESASRQTSPAELMEARMALEPPSSKW